MSGRARALPVLLGFGCILLIMSLAIAERGADAWGYRLYDSDNFMRLTEVRDWLGGQSWWDLHQYRIDPPAGLLMHWSRLADLPIAAMILAAGLFATPAVAEHIAVFAEPLLLLLVALALVARLAFLLAGTPGAIAALFLAAVTPFMFAQFVPGRIDHHGLQIVLVLATVLALASGTRARHGLAAALATALSLNIGLETAPLLASAGTFVAVRWAVLGRPVARVTAGYGVGVALLTALVFALTMPVALWAVPHGDALARGHLVAALVAGLGLAALALVGPARAARLIGVALLGGGVAVLVKLVFPEVLGDPYAVAGPLLQRLWLANINEMRSVVDDWQSTPVKVFTRLTLLLPAAVVAAVLAVRRRRVERDRYALFATLTVTALAIAAWQLRGMPLATAVAVPVAGAVIGDQWRRLREERTVLPLFAALLLLPTWPGVVLAALTPAPAGANTPPPPDCMTPEAMATLARAPQGLVLSPIDLGGPIITLTAHSAVTASIHRNAAGNTLAYTVLRGDAANARALLTAHRVAYVAWCPGPEVAMLARDAPRGLVAGLARGRVPAWLIPIAAPGDPLRLYRVAPTG